ncbi:sensor histidine kinase [Alcaligenes nematophilus]|uniref:histidine kinase n=1 Tax=Alcaligenes faecalis TaxID=511 RepID=A0A2U2BNQ2_ALCFA|nr:ATP-binding protein [Alcaligenes faecalis]PWE15596.1 hypothetical protein DF183_02360 [Alcaligenes faecalis]
MERDQALRELKDGSPLRRFAAARVLADKGLIDDVAELLVAKSLEAEAFVLVWLDQAILRCRERESQVVAHSTPMFDPIAYRKAVEWVTGVFVHEIGNKFGLAEYSAGEEIADYANSKTRTRMLDLSTTLEAIEDLQLATKSMSQEEFDLAGFVDQTIFDEQFDGIVELLAVGPRPMLVFGVPRLLKLALRNALRNAVEASKQVEEVYRVRDIGPEGRERRKVVVNWGLTDTTCYVSVLDSGIGVPKTSGSWFDLGATTKRGHSGFGLAIARQAMETMDGAVELGPSNGGGAKFLITWQLNL